MAMRVNEAAQYHIDRERSVRLQTQSMQSPINSETIERAAEALFEFVFSGCNRLDGKRRGANCDEETKIGFRREAAAALEAVWPILLRQTRPRALRASA